MGVSGDVTAAVGDSDLNVVASVAASVGPREVTTAVEKCIMMTMQLIRAATIIIGFIREWDRNRMRAV